MCAPKIATAANGLSATGSRAGWVRPCSSITKIYMRGPSRITLRIEIDNVAKEHMRRRRGDLFFMRSRPTYAQLCIFRGDFHCDIESEALGAIGNQIGPRRERSRTLC